MFGVDVRNPEHWGLDGGVLLFVVVMRGPLGWPSYPLRCRPATSPWSSGVRANKLTRRILA